MDQSLDPCVAAYRDLRNLKLVGERLGIPWQTVYVRLKRAGEPVTGDKARYGSETDRLAARAERWFQAIVPEAVDLNLERFQAPVDFKVGRFKVDVKVSRGTVSKTGVRQWIWSVKKQEAIADFIVCIGVKEREGDLVIASVLAVPGELVRFNTSVRASLVGNAVTGKWGAYSVTVSALRELLMGIN